MSRVIKIPEEMYNNRKKMSKVLDCSIAETFKITDDLLAQKVKKYRPTGRGKKKRYIIDIFEK